VSTNGTSAWGSGRAPVGLMIDPVHTHQSIAPCWLAGWLAGVQGFVDRFRPGELPSQGMETRKLKVRIKIDDKEEAWVQSDSFVG
jgi:hypothetical protein